MTTPMPAAPEPEFSALLTDLYQLTMAHGYWHAGNAEQEAAFQLVFRKNPFGGGFTVAAGLDDCIQFLRRFHFAPAELDYLGTLSGRDGKPLFAAGFLAYLGAMRLELEVEAVPEGTVVFPQEPLVRVRGKLLQAQIVETALLNFINFQSLIATKAARVCLAAEGDAVIEFGLRRAQGVDGALRASRAAYVGGCVGTSNVEAGRRWGIPVMGTHAHSWVMAFPDESEAFRAYAQAMPNNVIFLVDTFDSLGGVRHAIQIGQQLAKTGHRLAGIRLDSGDLAYLSIEARKLLNAAGFADAAILASNDLDEYLIASLKQQGAAIDTWGVGTKLVTAYDQPALGGVYKLAALRDAQGRWMPKLKLSEEAGKVTTPGLLGLRRFRSATEFIGDAIFDASVPLPKQVTIVDPMDSTRRKRLPRDAVSEDLLVPVLRRGELVYEPPLLADVRSRLQAQLAMLHPGIKRFANPHRFPAGLELGLHERKTNLILEAREQVERRPNAPNERGSSRTRRSGGPRITRAWRGR